MRGLEKVHYPDMHTNSRRLALIASPLLIAGVALTGCGSGGSASPDVTVTVTPSVDTTTASVEPTPMETSAAATTELTEDQVLTLMPNFEDLESGKTGSTSKFIEESAIEAGPFTYFPSKNVKPAECKPAVEGPFNGVSADPAGPIIWSAQRDLQEEKPYTYAQPLYAVASIDVFASAADAQSAYETLKATFENPNCSKYSYETSSGKTEMEWNNVVVDIVPDSVWLQNKSINRIFGLVEDRIWTFTMRSGKAESQDEVDRFRQLIIWAYDYAGGPYGQ